MKTGLVVGKFCPLHKGHEALIAFAQARCDRLVILSYTKPEFADCPPERRAAWLAALYPEATRLVLDDAALAVFAMKKGAPPCTLPHNDAPAEDHRAFVAWVCQTMLGLTVQRVFTSEDYGDGFADALARDFGHPVEHVAFDPARSGVPVSGTLLRGDRVSHRAFLSEPVRRSLVRRVALIGGESTGKTMLAAALAADLGTCWVPEYGRELWEQRSGELRYEDMLAIAHEQVAREDRARADAEGWLICDTTPLVTAFYSEALFGGIDTALEALAARRYDHLFLCAADFPFVQDGTRRDAAFRQRQNDWYRGRLDRAGVSYTVVSGSVADRRTHVHSQLGLAHPA
ncbi:AAA family ATPase [Sphingopyxis panaciterrae]